jgi:Site-specific recombinase XerD
MARVRITLFTSKKLKDDTCPIMLRITHKKKLKYIYLNVSAKKEEWDDKAQELKTDNKKLKRTYKNHNIKFQKQYTKALEVISEFETKGKEFTVDQIADEIIGKTSTTYLAYTKTLIEELKEQGRGGNARAYQSTYNITSKFLKSKEISFDQIDYSFLKKFETFLIKKGTGTNGRAFHMKTLRAIYNRAVKEGVAKKDLYPFDNFKIKTEKTAKRALTKDEIIQIRDIDLGKFPAQERARDLFMFSFYCMGMSFVDIAYLKVKDIQKGRLNYSRQKTTQLYNMAILDPALVIIKRYSNLENKDEFVFPILDKTHPDIHSLYLSQMRNQNRRLKEIEKKLELSIPLTSYVSRHSWATIAKRSGIPTAVISEGLGHTTEKTTQIYLDSFENRVLDEANKIITL